MSEQMDLAGRKLGPYQVIRELGHSRRAAVYEARQLRPLERLVALKVLAPALSQDREFAERFLGEARATSRLSHRHIVTIYDVGESDDLLYIAMERLSGRTLGQMLDPDTPMPPERALPILAQIASALDYAHTQEMLPGVPMIHGNIKPSNIFIEEGPAETVRTILMDFGLAKAFKSMDSLADTIAIFGTPKYMSPELIECQAISPAADLYALGVIAFEMLTGRVPFMAKSVIAILFAHVNAQPPDPRHFTPDLPPGVTEIFMRALAKVPAERFPSALEFVHALREAAQEPQAPARKTDVEESNKLRAQVEEYKRKVQALEKQIAEYDKGEKATPLNPPEQDKIDATQKRLDQTDKKQYITYRTALHRMLDKHFDMEELRTLCFDLDVDYDSLRGEGKTGKARELVVYLDSHDRINEIVEIGLRLWPKVPWDDLPGTPEQEQVRFENISPGQRPAVIPPDAEAKDAPKD